MKPVTPTLEDLLAKVRSLPPMTPDEKAEQAMDWAYGNLACSTNHKPTREGFAALAADKGWSDERFAKWWAARARTNPNKPE